MSDEAKQQAPGGQIPMDASALKASIKEPPKEEPKQEKAQEAPKEEPKEPVAPPQPSVDERITRMLRKMRPSEEKSEPKEAPKVTISQDTKAKIDQLTGEGKFSEAIELVQAETAKQLFSSLELRGREYDTKEKFFADREKANAEVYRRHPELLEIDEAAAEGRKVDKAHPFAEEVHRVYEEYPEFLNSARGPVAAVDLAEKRIKDREALAKAQDDGRKQEVARAAAATAASALGTSAAPPPAAPEKGVALNEAQKLIAMKMGIAESDYARMSSGRRVVGKEWYQKHSGLPKRIRG